MSDNKQRMIAGELYLPGDPILSEERAEAQRFMHVYNSTTVHDSENRNLLLNANFGGVGNNVRVRAPVYIDYGYNIFLGNGVFFNYGCVLLDVCPVTIGDNTQIGPGVQLYAADHPRNPEDREAGYECGAPITIGKNVWIGGHAIILPGVTVGDNAIIGAGSVVTGDVSEGTTVVGNPARVK